MLGTLLAEGLVDELCTALAPMVVGGSAGRIVNGPWLSDEAWHLRQLLETDGFLFARWGTPMKLPLSPPIAPMLAKSVKGVPEPSSVAGGCSTSPSGTDFAASCSATATRSSCAAAAKGR